MPRVTTVLWSDCRGLPPRGYLAVISGGAQLRLLAREVRLTDFLAPHAQYTARWTCGSDLPGWPAGGIGVTRRWEQLTHMEGTYLHVLLVRSLMSSILPSRAVSRSARCAPFGWASIRLDRRGRGPHPLIALLRLSVSGTCSCPLEPIRIAASSHFSSSSSFPAPARAARRSSWQPCCRCRRAAAPRARPRARPLHFCALLLLGCCQLLFQHSVEAHAFHAAAAAPTSRPRPRRPSRPPTPPGPCQPPCPVRLCPLPPPFAGCALAARAVRAAASRPQYLNT